MDVPDVLWQGPMRYERTGEYRRPKAGEWYEHLGRLYVGGDIVNAPAQYEPTQAPEFFKAWILREVEDE